MDDISYKVWDKEAVQCMVGNVKDYRKVGDVEGISRKVGDKEDVPYKVRVLDGVHYKGVVEAVPYKELDLKGVSYKAGDKEGVPYNL